MEKTVDPDGYIKSAILKAFRGSSDVLETVIPDKPTEEWSNEHHMAYQCIVDKDTPYFRMRDPWEDVNWCFWRDKKSERLDQYIYLQKVSAAVAEEEQLVILKVRKDALLCFGVILVAGVLCALDVLRGIKLSVQLEVPRFGQ